MSRFATCDWTLILKEKPLIDSFEYVEGEIDGISYQYMNYTTLPFEDIEEYERYRAVNAGFDCIRTIEEWMKFLVKLYDAETGNRRKLTDMEWVKLVSVIQGYRMGLWDLPAVTSCQTVKEKLEVINAHNRSKKKFKESNWKNCRRPERASSMLPKEMLLDLLLEFEYKEKFRITF